MHRIKIIIFRNRNYFFISKNKEILGLHCKKFIKNLKLYEEKVFETPTIENIVKIL